jgi:hypothetical protein
MVKHVATILCGLFLFIMPLELAKAQSRQELKNRGANLGLIEPEFALSKIKSKIEVSNDDSLCGQVRAGIHAAFANRFPFSLQSIADEIVKVPDKILLDWGEHVYVRKIGRMFYQLNVDLDGDGQLEGLVQYSYWPNWRGEVYSVFVFSSPQEAQAGIETITEIPPQDRRRAAYAFVNKGTPLAPEIARSPNFSNKWPLIQYNGRVYIGVFERVARGFNPNYSFYQLDKLGKSSLQCTVKLFPKFDVKQVLSQNKNLNQYWRVLKSIAGGYGRCGTIGSGRRMLADANRNLIEVLLRPWTKTQTTKPVRYGFPMYHNLKAFLKYWGYLSLSNHRVYRHLDPQRKKAINDLSNYTSKCLTFHPRSPHNGRTLPSMIF